MLESIKKICLLPLSILLLNCGGGNGNGVSGGGSSPKSDPYVMGYFPNYYGYFNNNSAGEAGGGGYGHAIAHPSYVMPGISYAFPVFVYGQEDTTNSYNQVSTNTVYLDNKDLKDKLEGLDALVYGFFTLDTSGAIQFSDSWSDLFGVDYSNPGDKVKELYNKPLGAKIIKVPVNDTLASVVHYGQFDAFIDLKKNSGKPLLKFISLGGWNGAKWVGSLSSESQISNFIQSMQQLHSVYPFDGIDFDIENFQDDFPEGISQFTTYFNTTFMNTINRLHENQPDLLISITIQADPLIINPIGNSLKLNKNKFIQLNLMTYDFNGAFNYNSATKSGVTGFNSNLYSQTGDNTPSKFSIDLAIESIKQYLPLSMVNIGLPAYGRAAITGVQSANGGLFQTFGDATSSKILPGDLDTSNCLTSLSEKTNLCSGTFQYRYIMNHMVGKGFVLTDWVQNGFYNGTTAYANSWTVESSSNINNVKSAGIAANYPAGPQSNVFISFVDAKVAKSYGTYVKQKGIKGTIVWDVMGDMPYDDTENSLIYNFRAGYLR